MRTKGDAVDTRGDNVNLGKTAAEPNELVDRQVELFIGR